MATAASPFFSLDRQPFHLHHHHHHHHLNTLRPPLSTTKQPHPFVSFPKSKLIPPLSTSHSSSSSSLTSSPPPPTLLDEQNPLQTGRFLTNEELEKLQFLENYKYHQHLLSGSLLIRVMRQEEMDITVALLSESFAESMLLPKAYVKVLGFLVKQYLIERRTVMPYAATLVGLYRESEEDDLELAGTVEVCFEQRGANANSPTPTPPKNQPYISNMTVKKPLRRRGIGCHLLKSSEDLISHMSSSREVYLHCRMIDTAPFNMYTKAGYSIFKTDSILTLLTLQRRKHLMCKPLPVSHSSLEIDMPKEELSL